MHTWTCSFEPSLMELGVHTCEVDIADILEQQCTVDGIHLRAEADFSRTQIFVHAMQSVSHGINCINHKLNFPLLFVG